VEAVFGNGGASTLCRPSSGVRGHERGVPRVRHFPQDRLQDLQSLQGPGARCAVRSLAPPGALCQPAARPDRAADRRSQARQAALGRAQIRELVLRKLAGDVRLPAKSTVHAVLDRHGLVQRARTRRNRANGTPLSAGAVPNALWCVDFKGEFKLGNGRYCYPLTVSDHASRYLLLCEAFESTREAPVIEAFQQLFRDRSLPSAIRSDNGGPFASPTASTISPACRSGGCGWASQSSASSPAIRSRMDAMSACI